MEKNLEIQKNKLSNLISINLSLNLPPTSLVYFLNGESLFEAQHHEILHTGNFNLPNIVCNDVYSDSSCSVNSLTYTTVLQAASVM